MFPVDALTLTDKDLIRTYISLFGNVDCGPISLVLKEWNQNKSTLFRAFGKKLSVSKEIEVPNSIIMINSKLASIYRPYVIYYDSDIVSARNNKDYIYNVTNNGFIADLICFWVNRNYCLADLRIISALFSHVNLNRGYIKKLYNGTQEYHCQDFKCTITVGMKTIRTIQKVLKATGYDKMDLFEEWRNQVSLVMQVNAVRKAKLVLSIHPIDFMSMSDNTCNWRSCMSWQHNGCYHAGTLEMMNSNVAAIAYLESESPFDITFDYTGEVFSVPNKSWRSLVFIHKDIVLCGKSYPYTNDFISKAVLDMVRELVKKNLKWSYKYINQEYKDLDNLDGNFYIRDYFDVNYDKRKNHHCIFVYTNGMYNDIIESHQTYWCCRNYVKKSKKICLSGPATCICCGKRLNSYPRESIYSYDDLGSTKICYDCITNNSCRSCGQIHYKMKYKTQFGNFCSDDCIKDCIVFPSLFKKSRFQFDPKTPISCTKDQYQFGKYGSVFLFVDLDKTSYEEIEKIKDKFKKIMTMDELNLFIRNVRINYAHLNVAIYKVSEYLSRCGAFNYSQINYSKTYDASWNYSLELFAIVRTDYNIDSNIEKDIKALQSFVNLAEYLYI